MKIGILKNRIRSFLDCMKNAKRPRIQFLKFGLFKFWVHIWNSHNFLNIFLVFICSYENPKNLENRFSEIRCLKIRHQIRILKSFLGGIPRLKQFFCRCPTMKFRVGCEKKDSQYGKANKKTGALNVCSNTNSWKMKSNFKILHPKIIHL